MAIRKFRSIEEVPTVKAIPLDGDNIRRAIELSDLCLRLSTLKPLPRGVKRFRSIEDADVYRRRWELERS